MSIIAGCVNFGCLPGGLFQVATSLPPQAGMIAHDLSIEPPVYWADVVSALSDVRNSIGTALASRVSSDVPAVYPEVQAQHYLDRHGWTDGFRAIMGHSNLPPLQIEFDYQTCWMWPEIVPAKTIHGNTVWLDQLTPIYRTLDHVWIATPRRQDLSLAIVYGENDGCFDFEAAAFKLFQELESRFSRIDLYHGGQFEAESAAESELLDQIFHQHRAIIFLGHSRPAQRSAGGGWLLNSKYVLEMARLERFFSPLSSARRRDPERKDHKTIPEVVFANCCFSTAEDPERKDQAALSYPKMFLDAGVESFIGTAMDVVMPTSNPQSGLDLSCKLVFRFFDRWVSNPESPIQNLHEAKRDCDFDLLTSLYQIYRASAEQVHTRSERRPLGSLVSSVQPDDRLGPYRLEKELWTDPWSRSFFAARCDSNGTEIGKAIVQILVDSLQSAGGLPDRIRTAIVRLHESGLENQRGILIPTCCENGRLNRKNQACDVLFLVYERPPDESGNDWQAFDIAKHRLEEDGDQVFVLQFAAELSGLLFAMHSRGIAHGNLDPYSIAFLRCGSSDAVVLRNIWVRMAGLSRSTAIRYASPDEFTGEPELGPPVNRDCWGLGVIIYETLVDGPPFDESHPPERGLTRNLPDVMQQKYALVPKALERIMHECLTPSAATRPNAEFICQRLQLALGTGGAYVGELESEMNVQIQAGKRLFYIRTRDLDDVERLLNALAAHPHPNRSPEPWVSSHSIRYRLYVVEEYLGLGERTFPEQGTRERKFRRVLIDWTELWAEVEPEIRHEFRTRKLPPPGYDEIAEFMGELILEHIVTLDANCDELPVVLFRGNSWWNREDHVRRLLRSVQSRTPHAPVVVIADDAIRPLHIGRSFQVLHCPTPSPAVLFERIRDFPRAEGLSQTPVDPAVAERLAHELYGGSAAEVDFALRRSALQYGAIDERLLKFENDARAEGSLQFQAVRYLPLDSLPSPACFAIPPWLQSSIQRWANDSWHAQSDAHASIPQRLLIQAPPGCGSTTLAMTLGTLTGRAIVQINLNSCITHRLGDSERLLHSVLGQVAAIGRGLVLVDDVHRFIESDTQGNGADNAARKRMESALLSWLDELPDSIVVACTVKSELPEDLVPRFAKWKRRFEWIIDLPEPTGITDAMQQYRACIFAATFRRYNLSGLATNVTLMRDLALETDPTLRRSQLPSPLQRRFESFSGHNTTLKTGDQIDDWIKDTITFLDKTHGPADQEAFWRAAIEVPVV